MEKGFELKSVIAQLRTELQAAEKEARGKDLRFGVAGVELEIKAALKKSEDVDCGFKVLVFSLGGKKSKEDEHSITVRLKLSPQTADGTNFAVAKLTAERPGTPERPGR